MAEANDELCLLIQVESRTALENLDAILEVDGIDGVFIGPADLSASLGYPDDAGHPDVQRVIEQSIRAFARRGKRPDFWRSTRRWRKNVLPGGPTSSPSGWIPCCIPRRWTAGWRCLNLPAPSRKRKRAIDGTGWRWAQTSACASTVSGCSQRLLVDISICHLQVSQSVTTRSAPLSSI